MFLIEALPTDVVMRKQLIHAVSDIEAEIQSQDAWNDQALSELLMQDSIDMLIVYGPEKTERAEENTVVGYCLYQVVFEQAEILRIGTYPDYQRQGIASQVFSKLHKWLAESQVESLLLEVRADNTAAIALYEQQGFTIIHRRKGYYQQPHQLAIDALIMQRVYTD
ncbi:ribosomal protein S18-alanine N-acetyltransferase [Psychrobacter sp. NG254]|uniref:ribosomal protein S18-alanine N-acetyltransferase n=1 Tax=Psychrobacter sp. NG254 TaxID=2782003 RepID=UPI001889A2A4|nr:ribosomal protein S18-alanine N-acetyltransferase [Psychrobacter sp. NG254]MBF2720605.1 ribosomal protein S18-alanine N-acetyltransferase [Psychrobacter sp. NG254]